MLAAESLGTAAASTSPFAGSDFGVYLSRLTEDRSVRPLPSLTAIAAAYRSCVHRVLVRSDTRPFLLKFW